MSRHGTILGLLQIACLLVVSSSASAQSSQKNWKPDRYEVRCDRDSNCLSSGLAHRASQFLKQAASDLRAMGFRPPNGLGPVVKERGKAAFVKVLDTGKPGIAATVHKCSSLTSHIEIGSGAAQYGSRIHIFFFLLAHEFFHAIQNNYAPFQVQDKGALVLAG